MISICDLLKKELNEKGMVGLFEASSLLLNAYYKLCHD
jgi:hypothetical protein